MLKRTMNKKFRNPHKSTFDHNIFHNEKYLNTYSSYFFLFSSTGTIFKPSDSIPHDPTSVTD